MSYALVKLLHLVSIALWILVLFSPERFPRRCKSLIFLALLGSGGGLIYLLGLPLSSGWMHGKITAVVLMGLYVFHPKPFPEWMKGAAFSAILLLWIAVMVVFKPF